MATIYVENKPYTVRDGQNLLHACLELGFDIPYFCWHPALGSVGACRQCAVKQFRDDKDTRGRIVMSCMVPAAEGTRISIDDPEVKAFRASVLEWLMLNHPHDCPVCDEGGECHLQDMTVMTGHIYRETRFPKRTHRNQNLGPLVNHEMNRCIQCYRCVRFYNDYAEGRDFGVFGAHDHVYFGRREDGRLESEFSGNLVEVCPTGVFTDKTLKRHYTRKWDLQTAPSLCVHCGLGCNTIPGERYGMLRRILNRYHSQVNGYFLCDRGRYGYEFVNSAKRIKQPLIRPADGDRAAQPASKEDVLRYLAGLLSGSGQVIGIGSPRASLEANWALRTLVGAEHFYSGLSADESRLVAAVLDILRRGPARSPSLADVALADAVLVLGEDVTNTAARMALALRQAARRKPLLRITQKDKIPEWNDADVRIAMQQEKGPLFMATPTATKLDDAATQTYHAAPDDLARLGDAVARALSADVPAMDDLPEDVKNLAQTVAQALAEAQRPLVVCGSSCGSEPLLQAAANIAWALCASGHPAELALIVPECNSLGAGLLGGKDLQEAFQAVEEGSVETAIVLENDLYRRAAAPVVDSFLAHSRHVVVLDHLLSPTTLKAEVVLPASTYAEAQGTLVNSEGRAQRFYQVMLPEGDIPESWRWLREMMVHAGRPEGSRWLNAEQISADLAQAMPVFQALTEIAPPADFRVEGLKIPRQPHRYSGRTAMFANLNVHEPQAPPDADSPLAFSMEGYEGQPPAALIPRYWAPAWNSVQALNKFQSEIGGPLRGGEPGCRLIEPAQIEKPSYFRAVPAPFASRSEEWLVVPLYHLFGSEELSAPAPGIAELVPQLYIALGVGDAQRLHKTEGEPITLAVGDITLSLSLKIVPTLPKGVAGLPVGLPGVPGIALPAWGKIPAADDPNGKGGDSRTHE